MLVLRGLYLTSSAPLLLLFACAKTQGGGDGSTGAEVCNGLDDDGDNLADEDPFEDMCGTPASGRVVCLGYDGCTLDCDAGTSDFNGNIPDGCECVTETTENFSTTCTDAVDLGTFADVAPGATMTITGVLSPADDIDYYKFLATDDADDTCDEFHVRVQFLANPGDQYAMDVWRGDCTQTTNCVGRTDFQWYTNYMVAGPQGQCPCTPDGNAPPRQVGVTVCLDETSEFTLLVKRRNLNNATCDSYVIEISNGAYPPPS